MQVDPRHRFDNFIVGSANRLAVAAARAVAESPGAVYNPLFIYSSSGLGKTHLMGAIGNHAIGRGANLDIEYVSLDDFVEQLSAAIASGEGERFKQRYQRVDVLLIDDMQFLTGRRETQTELLRLLNAMQGSGRQIVMSSDRPAEIADVDERLITRLAGGLIVDIGTPDFETRIAIMRAKCEERGVKFWPGVIEELGRLEFRNVRELQGALNRLIAFQTLGGEQIKPEDVLTVLGDLPEAKSASRDQASAPKVNEFQSFLTDIASAVAQHVESWKARVAEAIAYWTGEGYRTHQLERLLQESAPPANWEAILRGFGATVERLKALEQQATDVDAALDGNEVFRDPERLLDRALAGATPPPGPSSAFTRQGFEVSSSNQLAVRAADDIVAEPGKRYSPLFIHGPSGVGKTHLMNAIGNELVDGSGGASAVACVSAQVFMDELIEAMQEGTVERWRARYRSADALLIDDVQFVAGKERTQEELFHVFNALHSEGKQLVFAAIARRATSTDSRTGCAHASRAVSSSRCNRPIARCGNVCTPAISRQPSTSPARSSCRISPSVPRRACARLSGRSIDSLPRRTLPARHSRSPWRGASWIRKRRARDAPPRRLPFAPPPTRSSSMTRRSSGSGPIRRRD